MYRYILNRLLLSIPTLIGAAALVFILMRLIPGDICVVRLGSGGSINPTAVANCLANSPADGHSSTKARRNATFPSCVNAAIGVY